MPATRSRVLRYATAGGAALSALLYLLLGLSVIRVVDGQAAGEVVPPLLIAAGLFAVLALLVARTSRRSVLLAGAALQILVIVGYVVIAAERTPAFEPWGVGLKVVQVLLLGALLYLAARSTADRPGRGPGTLRHV
jgi:hypothetical protein